MKCKIRIVVKTGMRIGGTEEYEIGGIDNVVIKLPNGMPYVPGSSIKGKLRSILEEDEKKKEEVKNIFGIAENNEKKESCVLFRDIKIDFGETRDQFRKEYGDEDGYIYEEMKEKKFIELKTENKVRESEKDKKKRGLRINERVVPGVVFTGEVIIREKNGMKADYVLDILNKACKKLSEEDYLGGSGSRGYGKVEVEIFKSE